ncbi:methyl-accepting chemotaxis protein [Jannaschia sp. M317]|uniref:methyl-accepting chemotaxis protein n=1 Tax=Jannaschia sp. M317 TaxID=2867011 RepID=UPI0021A8A89B|nr:methyl-accepting chemotaxis protein [Jannaschia sp. M317]UWQ17359.1 HAMP domain-containing protein [Jannaschia sp. M317]
MVRPTDSNPVRSEEATPGPLMPSDGAGSDDAHFPWWRTIVLRCVVGVLVVLTLAFAFMFWLTTRTVDTKLGNQFQAETLHDADRMSHDVTEILMESGLPGIRRAAGQLLEGRGQPILAARLILPGQGVVWEQEAAGVPPQFDGITIPDPEVGEHVFEHSAGRFVAVIPLQMGQVGVVQAVYDGQPLKAAADHFYWNMLATQGVTLILVTLAIMASLHRNLTQPLGVVTTAMQAIARDRVDVTLPVPKVREVAQINKALAVFRDNVTDRLAYAERSAEAEARSAELQRERQETDARDRAAAEERVRANEARAEDQRRLRDALDDDLQSILGAATEGDFGVRMPLDDTPEEQHSVRQLLNRLLDELERGIEDVVSVMSGLADGRLHVRMEGDRTGAFGDLQGATNRAASRIQETFEDLFRHSSEVLDETSDLSASAEELSKRTERTAGSLAETTGALEQITGSIAATAELAQGARGFTESAREDARQSDLVVQEAIESMREIQAASTEISRTLGVINDIAFQTNLLALNAGVEAARAGEAGRGFAVVASEVRALAQRASDAARQIGELITTSSDQINLGVQRVARTGDTLVTLGERIDRIGDQVAEISLAADDQSASVAEINRAMGEIDTATQQNTAMFEEMSTANLSLKGAASKMLSLIEHFERYEAVARSAREDRGMAGDAPAAEYGVVAANAEEVRKWDLAIGS